MRITDEVKEISMDAIEVMKEVGEELVIEVIKKDKPAPDTPKDTYAEFYGQTKDSEPVVVSETYTVNATCLLYTSEAETVERAVEVNSIA